MLALAHLRCGDTCAQLAAGLGIGIATACRYRREASDILAAQAPSLAGAVQAARGLAFVILDGTLLPVGRVAADRPYHSEKHKRHGMNVQVLTDPHGRPLWASPVLPDPTHGFTAAGCTASSTPLLMPTSSALRTRPVRVSAGVFATRSGPVGSSDGSVGTTLPTPRSAVSAGEQAMATLKCWRLPQKLRCCPDRTASIVKAVLVLHHASAGGCKRLSRTARRTS